MYSRDDDRFHSCFHGAEVRTLFAERFLRASPDETAAALERNNVVLGPLHAAYALDRDAM
jgi:hypothetical protein